MFYCFENYKKSSHLGPARNVASSRYCVGLYFREYCNSKTVNFCCFLCLPCFGFHWRGMTSLYNIMVTPPHTAHLFGIRGSFPGRILISE